MIRRHKLHCHKGGEECICKPTPKIPLISTTKCSDDLAAVLALPDQWTPRRSGATLTNYLKERKLKHENTLKDLTEQTAVVNRNINDKIRELAELLLVHIKDNQKEMDCVVENYQGKESPLPNEDRKDAFKQIKDLFSQRVQELLKYKGEAHALEKQRADGLKNVLQCHFQKAIAIGHSPPKDLLHDFDERIFGVNQQLISNSRAYVDLEVFLRNQLDVDIVCLRSSINELCFITSGTCRRQSALPWTRVTRLYGKRSSTIINKDKFQRSYEDGSHRMTLDLGEFGSCVNNLVDVYRGAIMNVFDDFSNHLDELQTYINDINFFNVKEDTLINMEDMSQRAMHRISNSGIHLTKFGNRELIDMTRNDLRNMQETLCFLGNRLRHTYSVLHDASLLLHPHMLRIALAQKLFITALEDMQTNYDIIELANEILVNISLEQMRGAPDADKVHQQYDNIINLFEKTIEIFSQHSEAEVSKLEDFMNLQPSITNILLSEYNCFLESNPKNLNLTSESFTISPSSGSIVPAGLSSLRATLPRLLMQTKLQNGALTNWMNGFLESLENNIRFVPEQLHHVSRKWVDDKIVLVNMRYSLKLISHSIRFERVKAASEARLAEISMHDTRLNDHLDAVYSIADSLPLEASEFLAIDAKELYPLCDWVNDIQHKLDELLLLDPLDAEVKRLKMSSYAARLRKHQQLFEESLDSAIDTFKKNFETRIQTIRISNVQFMAQLKLFNEKGRYSAAEAVKTCSLLVKAGDALESCCNRTFDALHHRQMQLLGLADQLLLPLQKVVEDVVKSSGKAQVEKKKPKK